MHLLPPTIGMRGLSRLIGCTGEEHERCGKQAGAQHFFAHRRTFCNLRRIRNLQVLGFVRDTCIKWSQDVSGLKAVVYHDAFLYQLKLKSVVS